MQLIRKAIWHWQGGQLVSSKGIRLSITEAYEFQRNHPNIREACRGVLKPYDARDVKAHTLVIGLLQREDERRREREAAK